ncbi:hypothetical protein [Sphingomonas sp. YL-JM2C]
MSLLRKITELVDKDVAANSKPLSIIGIAIPFVPFMIFVDGSPADRYPLLSALALAAGCGWGLFVMWRYARHLRTKLSQSRKAIGSKNTWLVMIATVIFILLVATGNIWLANQIGWPEAYGFNCHGRGCILQDMIHSPKLLERGNVYELGLFVLLWLLPTCLVGVLIYALIKRLSRRDPIQ